MTEISGNIKEGAVAHYEVGLKRDRLAPPGEPPAAIEHHPYALDLDIFGRASLLQWLGPSATLAGADALQHWLLHPASPAAIAGRQTAVAELAPALAWREHFAAHGRLVSGVRRAEFDLPSQPTFGRTTTTSWAPASRRGPPTRSRRGSTASRQLATSNPATS